MKSIMKTNAGKATFFGLLVLASACHKDNNTDSTVKPSYLASFKAAYGNNGQIDSFQYDGSKRLATRWSSYYNLADPEDNDSTKFSFSFPGSETLPASYTISDWKGTWTENHQLSYDAQGRISRDSVMDANSQVLYFSYGTGIITIKTVGSYGSGDYGTDSLQLTNGNVVSWRHYFYSDYAQAEQFEYSYDMTYGAGANPFYNKELAKGFGPLLWYISFDYLGTYGDAISPNVIQSITTKSKYNSTSTTFSAQTDAQGRVSLLTPSIVDAPTMTFRYY